MQEWMDGWICEIPSYVCRLNKRRNALQTVFAKPPETFTIGLKVKTDVTLISKEIIIPRSYKTEGQDLLTNC